MALTLDQIIGEVRAELQDKLRLRGATLAAQLRKAGRMLPGRVRREAGFLVQAQALAGNPKLARQIDMRRAKAAHRSILEHLETVDIGAERRNRALGIAGSIGFAILVTGIGVLVVLYLRGFI